MTSITVSLPNPLKTYVESQIADGEYGTPSDYIRDLIRQDRERSALRLEGELLDALGSPRFEIDLDVLNEDSLIDELRAGLQSAKL